MTTERKFTRLEAADVARLLPLNPHVFDTRDEKSFAAGHIDGATLLNGTNVNSAILKTPRHEPVLIYCYHGNASQVYAQMFADFGFAQVHDLVGGYKAWRAHGAAPATPSPRLRAWLLAHGFSAVDAVIANATTPLMHAARLGDVEVLRELLSLGVVLDALNLDGNHALWLACFNGSLDAIDALIAAGIAIDHQNDNGATCLMYASSAGKAAVVARLLAAGADVMLESLDGFSALDMAANIECLKLLRQIAKDREVQMV